MKRFDLIGMLILLMAACTQPNGDLVETRFVSPTTASTELSAIDSLMWQQPNSAFAVLLDYLDNNGRDAARHVSTEETFDRHYANLLLAELLYKNDYAQTNRPELLRAVHYYDSLCCCTGGACTASTTVFLDARAHYINGVGYYENDSVVEACKEYLKALEMMEEHFEEKELVGKKAKFMTYTYNRLGDMFSEQFMMEPAIACYEKALVYCRIEPTSPTGVSNILSRLGLQYDELGNNEKTRDYYNQALEEMPNSDNLSYRDLLAGIALSNYQLGFGIEQSLETLRQITLMADNESERLTRYLTIGSIFSEEGIYDSALFYLEPVLKNEEDVESQIQAAECLRIIYDSIKDYDKLNQCLKFLAVHKKTEGSNKVLVSQLEDLFKTYLNQKMERQAEEARKKSIRKKVGILVPIAAVIALAIIIIVKLRGKKQLRQQQEKADKMLKETEIIHKTTLVQQEEKAKKALEKLEKQYEQELICQRAEALETERTHKIQQSALSNRLKRSNKELRELKTQMKLQMDNTSKKGEEQASSFVDEPICRLVMQRVNEGQFLSQMDCKIYKDYALSKEQLLALSEAANRHFNQFTVRLASAYPELTRADLDYCCLYLLGLTDADIAALMQRAYNTINERNSKLRRILGSENAISITLQAIAKEQIII